MSGVIEAAQRLRDEYHAVLPPGWEVDADDDWAASNTWMQDMVDYHNGLMRRALEIPWWLAYDLPLLNLQLSVARRRRRKHRVKILKRRIAALKTRRGHR